MLRGARFRVSAPRRKPPGQFIAGKAKTGKIGVGKEQFSVFWSGALAHRARVVVFTESPKATSRGRCQDRQGTYKFKTPWHTR